MAGEENVATAHRCVHVSVVAIRAQHRMRARLAPQLAGGLRRGTDRHRHTATAAERCVSRIVHRGRGRLDHVYRQWRAVHRRGRCAARRGARTGPLGGARAGSRRWRRGARVPLVARRPQPMATLGVVFGKVWCAIRTQHRRRRRRRRCPLRGNNRVIRYLHAAAADGIRAAGSAADVRPAVVSRVCAALPPSGSVVSVAAGAPADGQHPPHLDARVLRPGNRAAPVVLHPSRAVSAGMAGACPPAGLAALLRRGGGAASAPHSVCLGVTAITAVCAAATGARGVVPPPSHRLPRRARDRLGGGVVR
eukprot:ctg_342.g239